MKLNEQTYWKWMVILSAAMLLVTVIRLLTGQ